VPREILQHPHSALREVCAPVAVFDAALCALSNEMFLMMYAAKGRGLAAPQIGETKRMFVMDATWKEGQPAPQVFVNPEIVAVSDETELDEEGCLSLIGIPCLVWRPLEVTLRWQDLAGARHEDRFEGFAARCVQHERDHLDGILCIDYSEAAP